MAWSHKKNPENMDIFLELVSALSIQAPCCLYPRPRLPEQFLSGTLPVISVRRKSWWTMIWLWNLLPDVTRITCVTCRWPKHVTQPLYRVGHVILLQGRAWERGSDATTCPKSKGQRCGGQRKKQGEIQVWWRVTRHQHYRRKVASENFLGQSCQKNR